MLFVYLLLALTNAGLAAEFGLWQFYFTSVVAFVVASVRLSALIAKGE